MPSEITAAAIISAFNPPAELPNKVAKLTKQVDLVVVVDDGSPQDPTVVLDQVRAAGGEVIRMPGNSGIASALNAGIRYAEQQISPDWFVTLDQDSDLDEGYVNAAVTTATRASGCHVDVGFVCAGSINNEPVLIRDPTAPFPESFDPMQSGSVIPASTFQRVGLLDEDLFIDAVDSDFTARVRRAGMSTLVGNGCNLSHSVGESRPMRILGWHVKLRGKRTYVYYHAPFRVYYIARNGVVLIKRYVRSDPRWILKRLYSDGITHALRFIYGPHRRQHAIAFIYGVRDGLSGRLGRIDQRLAKKLNVAADERSRSRL